MLRRLWAILRSWPPRLAGEVRGYPLQAWRLMVETDPHGVQAGLALIALCWGTWVAAPWVSLASTTYSFMSSLAPEPWWGVFACLIGLVKLRAAVTRSKEWVTSFLGMMLWTFLTVGTALGNIQTPAVVTFGALALIATWTFIRIMTIRLAKGDAK